MTPIDADMRLMLHDLEANLQRHLLSLLPKHPIAEAYTYAVFPPGKLFRPSLVRAISSDWQGLSLAATRSPYAPESLLASAIELHHAYSLVHDDMPCMDNADERRGKPSTHKKFGEWRALLVGDGLLNASYALLTQLPPSTSSINLLRFFTRCTGPRGLIQGQVLDLSLTSAPPSFDYLCNTHLLKTARLIQVAVMGTAVVMEHPAPTEIHLQQLYRLGHHLGLSFQLLDDLDDKIALAHDPHEQMINPFFHYPEQAMTQLMRSLKKAKYYLQVLSLKNTERVLQIYWEKNYESLSKAPSGEVSSELLHLLLPPQR